MNFHPENIYSIPVGKDFLVYAPFTSISALMNRQGVIELREQLRLAHSGSADPGSKLNDLAMAISLGASHQVYRKSGEINPDFLGIIPTRSCNGACNYCDFGAGESTLQRMPYAMVTKAIDWYTALLKSQNRRVMEIHFFGGEPMVAPDIIEVAVERARLVAAENDLITCFEISTNGQFSSEHARYLGNYFNKVVLSLDGLRDIQYKHRPLKDGRSSFENAVQTAKIISNSSAELCIRCCISKANLSRMEEFTVWACSEFRLSAINFEILTTTEYTCQAGLYPPDPFEFAINFENSRNIARSCGVEVIYASDISPHPTVSSCPVGKDTAIFSPDGRISNCYLMPERWKEKGLELDFGSLSEHCEIRIDTHKVNAIRNMVEDKPRCEKCFCRWSCAGSCHVGISYPGANPEYNNFCVQTRLISAFTLLADLGLPEKISELTGDLEQMKFLADQTSDNILYSQPHSNPDFR